MSIPRQSVKNAGKRQRRSAAAPGTSIQHEQAFATEEVFYECCMYVLTLFEKNFVRTIDYLQ